MLSSVLHSERAVEINVQIMRAFVRLREMMASNKDLARKLDALERKLESHDIHIRSLFEAIRQLMASPTDSEQKDQREIGFHTLRESKDGVPLPRKIRRVRY